MQNPRQLSSSHFQTYHLQLHSNTERSHTNKHTRKPSRKHNFETVPKIQEPQPPRTRSQFARRTLMHSSRDPKWKFIFQSNGISPLFATSKLTHSDIARLSEIIRKESQALTSIRRVLHRFQQQVKVETVDTPVEKVVTRRRNEFIESFSMKINSHMPESLIFRARNNKLPIAPLIQQQVGSQVVERNKTESKKIRVSKSRSLSMIKANKVKEFQIDSEISKEFERKLYKYLEFILLVNLSNRVYRDLDSNLPFTPKYYVGFGNNGFIIQSIMKKRGWWQEGTREESHFVWTQLKVNSIYPRQRVSHYTHSNFDSSAASLQEPQKQPILKLLDPEDWGFIRKTLHPSKQRFNQRIQKFKRLNLIIEDSSKQIMCNHLCNNFILGNKKDLFLSLKLYYSLINRDIWSILPETYYISNIHQEQFKLFVLSYHQHQSKVWIVKPAQLSNRGQGITVTDSISAITNILKSQSNSKYKSYIVQHYINNPYLYNRRKFDIRAYMLLTTNNGVLKGYWYQEGYIRTSSEIFDLSNLGNTYTHLTNDAIQKYSKKYGKYEEGNKLSYADFQRYLTNTKSKHNFYTQCLPRMKTIALDAIRSTTLFLNRQKHMNNFEVFGLDFMINSRFEVNLIEINTNPCLETECTLLSRIIPNMLENAFRIGLDPIFPPPYQTSTLRHFISQNAILFNRFELIFDEIKERPFLQKLYSSHPQSFEGVVDQIECNANQQTI